MRDPGNAVITIRIDPPHGKPMAITREIGLYQTLTMFAPIDFPSADAGIAMMFCTPDADRKLRERKELVADIAHILAIAMVDCLGARDTEMGYPKER